jgi:hypothetical protein
MGARDAIAAALHDRLEQRDPRQRTDGGPRPAGAAKSHDWLRPRRASGRGDGALRTHDPGA